MTDHYVESAWRLRHRLRTAWRAWKSPHVARAMMDAYDHGQAVVTVGCSTWRDGEENLVIARRPGMQEVALERPPVLHIPRRQVPAESKAP